MPLVTVESAKVVLVVLVLLVSLINVPLNAWATSAVSPNPQCLHPDDLAPVFNSIRLLTGNRSL